MLAADLTESQLNAMSTIERVGSTLSLLGCCFIIITFLASTAFHKPINRLVFYASVGNIMTNVATLVARSSLAHVDSFLCQFQGFLIQMFMPADAYWTLAMAMNVYLTFYWKFDGRQLRNLEIPYVIACYGVPFIPALVFIWIKTAAKGRMYGNATLWCWISSDWDIWRIGIFYGPVWVAILITIVIYVRAGSEIYRRRRQLGYFSSSRRDVTLTTQVQDPFTSMKTTEVFVTSEQVDAESADSLDLHQIHPSASRQYPRLPQAAVQGQAAYSVSVSTSEPFPQTQFPDDISAADEKPGAAIEGELRAPPTASQLPISERPDRRTRTAAMEAHSATWAYTKVAVLFFAAMMVTWIPSSANRVYSVVHVDQVSIPLLYASSLVLPLQGFWNAVIYISTSMPACRTLWTQMGFGRRSRPTKVRAAPPRDAFGDAKGVRLQSRRGKTSLEESESMTELASRPGTGHR